MSLILEALRRADAERQRGAVPGLHAQTGMALPPHGGSGPQVASGQRWLLLGAVGAVLLGGLGALAWVRLSTPAPLPVAATLPPVAAVAAVAVPAAVPLAVTAAPVAAAPAPPLPTVLAAAPADALPQPAALPMPRPVPISPLAALALPRAAAPQRAATATPPRLPTLAELPDALRRELPAMTLGGSMYAEQPALRMVIINGQVVHEGDRLAPELLVQQIRQKSVVLNWRGQAFELGL